MKKIIITTTINPPTEALKKFKEMKEWELIVIGDKKTPHALYKDYDYISPKEQEKKYPELSKLIGWNCIQRRNIGFIEAYKRGADVVATIDDDNIPHEDWGKDVRIGRKTLYTEYTSDDICFDPLSVTNHFKYWHRGFPIQLLHNRNLKTSLRFQKISPDIQANFWNGSPDIDAICRMEHNPNCNFLPNKFPFTSFVFSPFNSQNTMISRKALKDYFMFPHIGRMDDIWASYYLEAKGYRVVYDKATVIQKRNEHNLTKDFKDEIIGYENTMDLLKELTKNPDNIKNFIPEDSWKAFQVYQKYFGDDNGKE